MAIEALRQIQIGQEATAGTKVPATAKLLGKLTMAEDVRLHRPDEERGSFADAWRTVLVGEGVALGFEGNLTYEQLPYLLAMAINNKVNGDTAAPMGVKYNNSGIYTSLANTFDANSATFETIADFMAAQDYIYVRSASKFRAIKVDVTAPVNAVASVVTCHVSDGAAGWLACTLVKDGTAVAGASMAQDGVIEFTPHASWLSDTVNADAGFWLRLTWSGNWTVSVKIAEIYTIALVTLWTYAPNLSAANTPQSYTIEYGDDVQEHEVEYVAARGLEMNAGIDAPITMKADLFGRNLAASTFTGALANPTVETAVSNKTRLYIDAISGAIGSTEKASTLISWGWKLAAGFAPVVHGSANLYFDALAQKKIKLTVDMTIVFNTGTEAERLFYVAGTRRLFRLKNTGALIAGSDYKGLTLDFAGVYTRWSTLQSRDGEDTVAVTVESEYDPTYAKLFEVVVQNTVAVLP